MKYLKQFLLKNITTMKIGGPARFLAVVRNETELISAIEFAKDKQIPWTVIGEGSNLIVSDRGYRGLIIQNQIKNFKLSKSSVLVGGGNNLLRVIKRLNRLSLSGMEKMAGIPGTVGGAIYGCAGAYGQEIKDHLVRVRIYDGKKFRYLRKRGCRFGYRTSIFKRHKNWIITAAEFALASREREELEKTSREIIKLRKIKYRPGLKCPGSFFKNIKLADLPAQTRRKFIKKIPKDKIMYGKVPSGYLLEEIGAKGMRQGRIRVANHHGNLIYNPDGGTAADVRKLATRLKALVKTKFGITIEEEVQYLE